MLPKSIRRKIGKKMRKTFRSISKSKQHADDHNDIIESPNREVVRKIVYNIYFV